MANQNRLWYGVQSLHFAECGTNTFEECHGVQSMGLSTQFNLEPIFEVGQIEVYELKENLPDVSLQATKVLDGYCPLYILATVGATSATVAGRSSQRFTAGIAYFTDTQDSASGTPLGRTVCSGMYPSAITYNMNIDGPCTEEFQAVGNNKVWNNAFTFTAFNNDDEPLAIAGSGGVNFRQNVKMGSSASLWPTQICGITSSGTNEMVATGDSYRVHFRSVRTSVNLGREAMLELGRRAPYHRYANFPIVCNTEISIWAQSGDFISALESSTSNVTNQTIKIILDEGLEIDLGTKNKLQSVNYGGANAGQNGGNGTIDFSFQNYGAFSVSHPQDPGGL